jgi:tripartite-type tricarboxylate transporter receptor subunit TctC
MKSQARQLSAVAFGMLALSVAIAGAASTRADNYPEKPITLVVPFGSGGGIDLVARIIAEKLQERMHQPVVVENRAGGGGIVGTSVVAHAKPDGYTLLFIEMSSVLAKWLHKKVPFNVETDLTPIAMVATNYLGLFANPSLPANNLTELIAYNRAHPTKLSIGTPGVGTPHHLAALMLNHGSGIELVNVSYRGTPPSVTDLVSGQIPLVWAVPVNVMPFVAQGKAKLLAISSPQRLAELPNVPTVAEQGLPDFSVTLWLGIAGPAGMPAEIVSRLSKAIQGLAELPDVHKRLSALGYNLDYRSPDKFREQMLGDQRKYGEVILEAGIQPN